MKTNIIIPYIPIRHEDKLSRSVKLLIIKGKKDKFLYYIHKKYILNPYHEANR